MRKMSYFKEGLIIETNLIGVGAQVNKNLDRLTIHRVQVLCLGKFLVQGEG